VRSVITNREHRRKGAIAAKPGLRGKSASNCHFSDCAKRELQRGADSRAVVAE
jgi:hypothetical protein